MCFGEFLVPQWIGDSHPQVELRSARGKRGGQNLRRPIPVLISARSANEKRVISNGHNSDNLIPLVNTRDISLRNATIATLNARSISNKIDIMKHVLYEENIDILGVTEIWLDENSEYESQEICPNGYALL